MSELLKKNDALVLHGRNRKNISDMIRIIKNKIFSNHNLLDIRRNDTGKCESSAKSDTKSIHINVAQLGHRPQLCSVKGEFEPCNIINSKHTSNRIKHKKVSLFRKKKSEEILISNEKKLSSKTLLEEIESARNMGNDRLKRANIYYNKQMSYVKYQAINEAAEFIINDLSCGEKFLLIYYNSKQDFINDSHEINLLEVYLKARSKMSINSTDLKESKHRFEEVFDECSVSKDLERNLNSEFIDTFSNLRLQGNENLNGLLDTIGTSSSNIDYTIEYLVSRTCNVSLEISKTVIDCIQKDIIDTNTGIYKGSKDKI